MNSTTTPAMRRGHAPQTITSGQLPGAALRSEKITAEHLQRLAIV